MADPGNKRTSSNRSSLGRHLECQEWGAGSTDKITQMFFLKGLGSGISPSTPNRFYNLLLCLSITSLLPLHIRAHCDLYPPGTPDGTINLQNLVLQMQMALWYIDRSHPGQLFKFVMRIPQGDDIQRDTAPVGTGTRFRRRTHYSIPWLCENLVPPYRPSARICSRKSGASHSRPPMAR